MPKYKLLDQAQSLVELRGYLNFNPKLDLFRLLLGYTFLFCKTKSIFSSKKRNWTVLQNRNVQHKQIR